jgi:hypothetical protein
MTRHRRPVIARTLGPAKEEPRHRRDADPDKDNPPNENAGAPGSDAGREDDG